MGQRLLFPDPKPLDQRLGADFFQAAPRRPGVYLMKAANDEVIYVGKAKNLKQRLGNYRLANPDRMPRRHLRMVREVARIEFQFCASETAALQRESVLLRSLRPRFNRAGVWPGPTQFLVWRTVQSRLELGVAEIPASGWHRFGPMNSGAQILHGALARLVWLALHPECFVSELPAGWGLGTLPKFISISCGNAIGQALADLEQFFWEDSAAMLKLLVIRLAPRANVFERAVIAADLEPLQNFSRQRRERGSTTGQLALL